MPPILQKNAGYDPLASYDPIVLVAQSSNLLVVHPSLPVNSVQELVAYAKANPGKVNFSSYMSRTEAAALRSTTCSPVRCR